MSDASNSAGAPPAPHAWRRMLDVSTGHLCRRTRDHLDNWTPDTSPVPGFASTAYGWVMWVKDDSLGAYTDDDLREVPPDLREVLAYAKGHGAHYVMLDADGADHDALPTYDDDGEPEGWDDWLDGVEEDAADREQAEAEARLDNLETAYLDGEVTRSQFLNGG